jgi:diguanylate cyclase
MMIDVDRFKDVNDRYGHEAGDRALTHIARLMTQALRTDDRLARFGGEEFVVLLPGARLAQAQGVAESLRLAVQRTPLAHGELLVPLSVSIGVAEWAGSVEDTSRLLVRADDALYRAKRLGRDRVEVSVPGAAEAPVQPAPT